MQYEPIKRSLGRFFSRSLFLRKTLYFLLDLLLLRTWHIKKTLRRISPQLPANASILDAGSGFGQYSWRMAKKNSNWRITGIDINSEQVDDCNAFMKNAGLGDRICFKTGDLTLLNETETYNLILSVDVMEHIEDDVKVFNNFSKALKKNGMLIISTPSDKGGSDVHDESEHSFIDEHVRDGYGIEEIRDKLTRSGFSSVDASYTYGWPGNISWRMLMKYPIKLLNASYLFFILLPFYYLIAFPVAIVFNILDLRLKHNTGTGLLVIAKK